jgi:Opioid growth factor receptor (OGFr) conserved region
MSFFSRRAAGSSASSLISFYEGTGRDQRGRSLSQILQWGADRLESSHDYIQTLFPLPEESGVNWNAPIIDRQVFDAFRSRMELRGQLRDSFQKILWFYGFKLGHEDGKVNVDTSIRFGEKGLTASRLAKVTTTTNIARIGIQDSITITSELPESSAASVFSALKMKQRHFTKPSSNPRRE